MVTRLIQTAFQSSQLLPIWRLLFVLWIAFVLYASLIPVDLDDVDFPMMDKLMHFAVHTANVLLAALAFPAARAFTVALVGLLILGPLIEVLQSFTPDRTAALDDQLANTIGFLFGWLLARYFRGLAYASE